MGVPARLTADVVAPHRLVTANGIFDRPCHHVVDAWRTVGGWWPFVEVEPRCTFFQPHLLGAFEGARRFPELKDTLFQRREVDLVVVLPKHCWYIAITCIARYKYREPFARLCYRGCCSFARSTLSHVNSRPWLKVNFEATIVLPLR